MEQARSYQLECQKFWYLNILKFIRSAPRRSLNCYNHKGIRIVARLRLGLSHLREHKFNQSFQNCVNHLCSCGMDTESTSHFFLYCPLFDDKRITFLSTLSKTDCKLTEMNLQRQINRDELIFF